ncbi:MAG: hypothetical protein ACE5OY_05920 [Candidatus Bathyarchaeia archaeon]
MSLASVEKFIATKMPGLASGGICLKKHDRAIQTLLDGLSRWLVGLEEIFGADFIETIRDARFELGREMGEQMKAEYGLGDGIGDALDLMWMLIVPLVSR